jgi:electron transfer flavoprotein beta subunit
MPVPVEMQAIRMASVFGGAPEGLHVGADRALVRDALGHGLSRLVVINGADDPLPALRDYLQRTPPDLLFAGRRGQGGTDSGLLPYRVAHALGWPIIADVARMTQTPDGWEAEQVLPRGARRVVRLRLPCVVSVHPAAAAAQPFCYAGLQGQVLAVPWKSGAPLVPPELRPYRARPKMMQQAATGGRVLANLSAEAAAQEIVHELRRLKLL